ncbi:group II intron reverse transcriptase/maturase [Geomonas sp. Red276]
MAKGNSAQTTMTGTPRPEAMSSGLDRVREAAKRDSRQQFTSLLHHVTIDLLRASYHALKRSAAAGIDGITWEEYGENLEEKLPGLHDRIQGGHYRARPSKRAWIPKPDGSQRPIGIAALEDKIVQQALVQVLQAVYEEDFIGFSYGSRPGRSQHDALDAIYVAITRMKVGWVLDADIRGFYDSVDHGWMMKFLEHRIADPRMLRLVRKFLRAGVSEEGEWTKTVVGTPQGAVISPLLANIYLHYVLDQWVKWWRRHHARGEVYIVRYVDDFVMGFQNCSDARRFRAALKERLSKFELELHESKTRLIEFGRFAESNRIERGEGRPGTFDFLGFTHICAKRRKDGRFTIRRKTIAKKLRAKIGEIRETLLRNRHRPLPEQGSWLKSVVQGHYNYYGVPGNRHPYRELIFDIS